MGLPPTQGHSNLRLPNTTNMYYNHRLDNIIQQHNLNINNYYNNYGYCQRHIPNKKCHNLNLPHNNQFCTHRNGDLYPNYCNYERMHYDEFQTYDEFDNALPTQQISRQQSLGSLEPSANSSRNSISHDTKCSHNWFTEERRTTYLCICKNVRRTLCFHNILTRHMKRVRFNRNILNKLSNQANGFYHGFLSNKST